MTALDCPVCHAPFKEIVNDGVLIDVCTECRGIWLDRGELEKLMNIAEEDLRTMPQSPTHSGKSKLERWLDPFYK